MAKAKSQKSGARNDSRPNGKAAKQNPGRRNTGSKSGRLDVATQVYLGKGIYQKWENFDAEGQKSQGKKKKVERDTDED